MRILCVHQGFELYGSDRSFIDCVVALRSSIRSADIDILLPKQGALSESLIGLGFSVKFVDLFLLRRSDLWRLLAFGLFLLPRKVVEAVNICNNYDEIYINTSVVIDFVVALIVSRKRAVVHVREIPPGPVRAVLQLLFRVSNAYFVFNSRATERAFGFSRDVRSVVCYNGYVGPAQVSSTTYDGGRPLRVLLAGRINAWKGHDLLIDAIQTLPRAERERLSVRIVGDAFEGQPFRDLLVSKIADAGIGSVELVPFTADIGMHYQWSDLVVVPSTRPEPFGRVAIEAFAFARAVLAAGHGGLTEIVSHEVNGWLFAPRDRRALAAALRTAIYSPDAVRRFGVEARAHYERRFTIEAAVECISSVFRSRFGAD